MSVRLSRAAPLRRPAAVTFVVGALLVVAGAAAATETATVDAAALPLATRTIAASAQQCAVWRRERSFSRSVEAHDAAAFASHVHASAVFDVGTPNATRGRDAIVAGWSSIIEGKVLQLRWRPGIVDVGGDPGLAVSRGPYILQTSRDGKAAFSVGFYQTVWRSDEGDGVWRILFDGGASTPMTVDSRAAADAWVVQQPMSDCASS